MQAGTRWPFDQAMASLMMVSANDAAYAVAGDGRRQHHRLRRRAQRDRAPLRHARQHVRRPGRPHRRHVVRRRTEGQRVRPRDRGAQRAHRARDRAAGPTRRRTTSPTRRACTTQLTNHDKFLPDNGFGYEGANGFKTGLHRGRRPHAGRHRQAQRPPVHRGDPRVRRQRLHVGGVAARQVLAEAAGRDNGTTRLPPVAVSPYATRVAAKAGFTNLAVGTGKLAARPRRHDDDRQTPRRRTRGTDRHRGAARERSNGRCTRPTPATGRRRTTSPACSHLPADLVVPAHRRGRGVPAPPSGEAPARSPHRPPARAGQGHAQREPARGRRPLPHRQAQSARRSNRSDVGPPTYIDLTE